MCEYVARIEIQSIIYVLLYARALCTGNLLFFVGRSCGKFVSTLISHGFDFLITDVTRDDIPANVFRGFHEGGLKFSLLLNFPTTLQTSHDLRNGAKTVWSSSFFSVDFPCTLALGKTISSHAKFSQNSQKLRCTFIHKTPLQSYSPPASMQPARTRCTCKTKFWRFLLVFFTFPFASTSSTSPSVP